MIVEYTNDELLEAFGEMTLVELSEFVKAFEEKLIINDDRWNGGTDAWLSAGGNMARLSMNSMPNTTTKAAIRPMKKAPTGVTRSHPAVMATRPAREPFNVMEISGFL